MFCRGCTPAIIPVFTRQQHHISYLLAIFTADKRNLHRVQRDLEELLPDGRVGGGLLKCDSVRVRLDQLRYRKLGDPRPCLALRVLRPLTGSLELALDVLYTALVPALLLLRINRLPSLSLARRQLDV